MYTKKFIVESLTMSQLSKTNYTNLKYDNDATKNDTVNKALLDDINAAAKSVGIVATITTARSGHNRNVKGSNRVSRHMSGTGVDVAILNGLGSGRATNSSNGNAEFRSLGNKLKNALVSMGYTWNIESGNDKAVLWQTNTGGNHYNHLHISNRTNKSSAGPVSGDSEDDEDDKTKTAEVVKTDNKKTDNKKIKSKEPLSSLDKLGLVFMGLAGVEPEEDDTSNEEDDEETKDTEDIDSEEETKVDLKTTDQVKVSGFVITEPSNEDKDFYIQVLEKINAPVTSQNLLFFYAWRQAEGAKSTFNPFNTTHKTDGSTFWNCLKRKEGKCLGGVRNYKSKTDGIEATVKTLQNGRYNCVVDKLRSNKGAEEIANCSADLKTWGTRGGILKQLKSKKIQPPPISKSKVKEVNENLNEELDRIHSIFKKII